MKKLSVKQNSAFKNQLSSYKYCKVKTAYNYNLCTHLAILSSTTKFRKFCTACNYFENLCAYICSRQRVLLQKIWNLCSTSTVSWKILKIYGHRLAYSAFPVIQKTIAKLFFLSFRDFVDCVALLVEATCVL